jgi:hypothetical protein
MVTPTREAEKITVGPPPRSEWTLLSLQRKDLDARGRRLAKERTERLASLRNNRCVQSAEARNWRFLLYWLHVLVFNMDAELNGCASSGCGIK